MVSGPTIRPGNCCAILLVVAFAALLPPVWAQEPAAVDASVAQRVDQLLVALDDPNFNVRRQAADGLQAMIGEASLSPFLAKRFQHALVSENRSFEVRTRLEALLRRLPETPPTEPQPMRDAIAPLLKQLNSDQYVDRDSSVRQLSAMLAYKDLIVPVWLQIKQRAADPKATASERRLLDPLIDKAHYAWLLSDVPDDALPLPGDEQIEAWIAEASKPENVEEISVFSRSPAERELLDLIARDDTCEHVLALLQAKIDGATDKVNLQRLQNLVDFARPGMAAEGWSNHTNTVLQYLLINVPQYNDAITPPRATHFDRIDDQTAHCVTGNSLTEGDYPVRVAIPHPEPGRDTMFYLTNLPTPRSRLAFEYSVRRDEHTRLAEISKRTLDYFLNRKTPLSEVEILLLAQLDPRAVSRFVGDYFASVPNAPLASTPNGLNSQTTLYGGICAVLSRVGTHDAVPALEKLARSGALGKPVYPNRVEVAWVALLAIAARDPWPEVDPWLAALIDETLPLTTDPDLPPELGASAAGLLIDRRGASVRPFGLVTAGESVTDAFQFYGYRFTTEDDRADVKRWWKKQQTIAAAAQKAGDGIATEREAPPRRHVVRRISGRKVPPP